MVIQTLAFYYHLFLSQTSFMVFNLEESEENGVSEYFLIPMHYNLNSQDKQLIIFYLK